MVANRVMTGVSSWIERKLFLKVNVTKSKVCRPMRMIVMSLRKLDVSIFSEKIRYLSIGKLDCNVIDFISNQKPEFKGKLSSDKDILLWKDRVKYTEKHRKDFPSSEEFDKCLEDIPNIIQEPDYISIHPNNDSICFILNILDIYFK